MRIDNQDSKKTIQKTNIDASISWKKDKNKISEVSIEEIALTYKAHTILIYFRE